MPPADVPAATEVTLSSPELNGTHFPQYEIGVGGAGAFFDPPRSRWALAHPSGGGGSTYVIPTGMVWDPVTWTDKQWSASDGDNSWVHTYHCGHWGGWVFDVDRVDASKSTLSFSRGGFQEARGCSHGAEWYISGVLAELDSPGEWFYDAQAKELYVYENTTASPAAGDDYVAGRLKTLVSIDGSMRAPVVDVSVAGLQFAHAESTSMDAHMVPSGGDWAIHRGAAFHAEGVEGLSLSGCFFQSVGGNAVLVGGYAREVVIEDVESQWSGASGIILLGDTMLTDATGGTQPRGTVVRRALVHEAGVFQQQSGPFMQALSGSTLIDSCVFFNTPRAAVNLK